jgi:hypothetical protein
VRLWRVEIELSTDTRLLLTLERSTMTAARLPFTDVTLVFKDDTSAFSVEMLVFKDATLVFRDVTSAFKDAAVDLGEMTSALMNENELSRVFRRLDRERGGG